MDLKNELAKALAEDGLPGGLRIPADLDAPVADTCTIRGGCSSLRGGANGDWTKIAMWVGIAVLALSVLGVGAYFIFKPKDDEPDEDNK